jgi:hypothetical protein
MPDRCATRAVQLHPFAAISWFFVVVLFWLHRLRNMLCCQHSQVWLHGMCLTASTHANKHAHIFHFVLLPDCAVAAARVILITAVRTGFVQQVVEVRLQARWVIQTDRTHPTGYIDVR